MAKTALLVINEPTLLRVVPSLACEIGLEPSILLLQVEWLMRTKRGRIVDGLTWVPLPIRELHQRYFRFWSMTTTHKNVKDLVDAGYLLRRDDLNDDDKDKTMWYSLGPSISKLNSAMLVLAEKDSDVENEERPAQVEATPAPKKNHWPMVEALAVVCLMDAKVNRGRLLKVASELYGSTTPEEVLLLFGKGGAWYRLDFRGKRGEAPNTTAVKESLLKLRAAGLPQAGGSFV